MKKAECDIKLGKSALWRARGQIQADGREVIHTLMEDSEFRSFSRSTGRQVNTGEATGEREQSTAPPHAAIEQERASGSPGTRVRETQRRDERSRGTSCAGDPRTPCRGENVGDNVGYVKAVAEELDPETMPLMAPNVRAR